MPIGVREPTTKRVMLSPVVAKNIMDILDADLNPTECMITPFLIYKRHIFLSKCVCYFNLLAFLKFIYRDQATM